MAAADTECNYASDDSGTYHCYKCNELPEMCVHDETHVSCGCGWLFVSCSSK